MTRETEADRHTDTERPVVTAHSSDADRTVFTENGNGDGWIASDLTLELRR